MWSPILIASALAVAACSPSGQASQADKPFTVTTSIKELMESMIDPSADALWEAVAVISTREGVENRHPRTDEEWKALRSHAITLLETTNLLVMEGRRAAPIGTRAVDGELSPEEIDRRISTSRAAFIQYAQALRAPTLKALAAIDRRDADELLAIGGEIDAVCEACHVTFWYPNAY